VAAAWTALLPRRSARSARRRKRIDVHQKDSNVIAADDRNESIVAATKIDGLSREVHPHARRQRRARSAATSSLTYATLVPTSIRTATFSIESWTCVGVGVAGVGPPPRPGSAARVSVRSRMQASVGRPSSSARHPDEAACHRHHSIVVSRMRRFAQRAVSDSPLAAGTKPVTGFQPRTHTTCRRARLTLPKQPRDLVWRQRLWQGGVGSRDCP
jgi:hypothetical protein